MSVQVDEIIIEVTPTSDPEVVTITVANNTDSIPEGVINLYFTTARVLATALTGLSLLSAIAITATDTVLSAFGKIQAQITANLSTLTTHIANLSNPHSVTATQVGLGNVDNTSDANKPVSTATQSALNAKLDLPLYGGMYMDIPDSTTTGTGLATMNATPDVYNPLVATTLPGLLNGFTHSPGSAILTPSLTYTNATTKRFLVNATIGFSTSESSNEYSFSLAVNGTRLTQMKNTMRGTGNRTSTAITGIVTLNQDDVITPVMACTLGGGTPPTVRTRSLTIALIAID